MEPAEKKNMKKAYLSKVGINKVMDEPVLDAASFISAVTEVKYRRNRNQADMSDYMRKLAKSIAKLQLSLEVLTQIFSIEDKVEAESVMLTILNTEKAEVAEWI